MERLCQENPNNALAFVQRLQVCALTPEGRDYIRNLDPETLQYLIQVGYKDEITKLLQDVPSYYVFKTDPVYAEDYMKNLVISDGPAEILQNESNLSLVPDPNEVSACTKGVELPWFRIKLPEAGTYELKQVEKVPLKLFFLQLHSKTSILQLDFTYVNCAVLMRFFYRNQRKVNPK